MLKFVQVSLNFVPFAVYCGFSISKELLHGDATNHVGNNLLVKMNFCLLVLLLALSTFRTNMFALAVWIVLPCACRLYEQKHEVGICMYKLLAGSIICLRMHKITPSAQTSAFIVEKKKAIRLGALVFYYPSWYGRLLTKVGVQLV